MRLPTCRPLFAIALIGTHEPVNGSFDPFKGRLPLRLSNSCVLFLTFMFSFLSKIRKFGNIELWYEFVHSYASKTLILWWTILPRTTPGFNFSVEHDRRFFFCQLWPCPWYLLSQQQERRACWRSYPFSIVPFSHVRILKGWVCWPNVSPPALYRVSSYKNRLWSSFIAYLLKSWTASLSQ